MLPAFGWRAVLTHWEFAPDVTAVAVAVAAAYLWGTWRIARRHPARPWPWWRTALFLCGVAVVVLAIESGIGTYDDVLAWDHMVQHLLLLMVAPPLLVAGQPVTLLLHASRNPLHTWVKRAIRSRVDYPIRLLILAVAMPVDTFTGLVLLYAGRGDVVPTDQRPPGAPAPV